MTTTTKCPGQHSAPYQGVKGRGVLICLRVELFKKTPPLIRPPACLYSDILGGGHGAGLPVFFLPFLFSLFPDTFLNASIQE